MKKILSLIIFASVLFLPTVNAKEVKLDSSSYTIKPGDTVALDIVIDSDEEIKSGSFMITTSSRYIGFESIVFEDGIKYSSSGSSYTFNVTKGALEEGSKIATVTLKALDTTKEGAKTTIVLSNLKVKNGTGKNTSFDTISQVVTCTEQEQKSNNNNLKEITSEQFTLNDFNSEKLEYTVEVNSDVEEVSIDAKAEDEKAEVKVEGTKLENGNATVKIIVTAENSEEKTYVIKVKQKEEESKKEVDKVTTEPKSYKGKWVLITIFVSIIVVANIFLLKKDK